MSNNNDNNPDTLLDNLDLNLDGDFEFEDGDLDKLLGNAGDLDGIGDLPDGDTPDGLGPPSSNAQNRQSLNLNTLSCNKKPTLSITFLDKMAKVKVETTAVTIF